MGGTDFLVIGIIALIIGGAVAYIIKAKKSGKKCIGCPDSATCGKSGCQSGCSGCSGQCHCDDNK